jgi:FkbM family methyltransferase
MKNLKKITKLIIFFPLILSDLMTITYKSFLRKIRPELTLFWSMKLKQKEYLQYITVNHRTSKNKDVYIQIGTPNEICKYRALSFSTKEPETLEWIDRYGDEGAFFDIGSNIGIYSLYFANCYNANVYAFEPSVFNLIELANNINRNKLSKRIEILPFALNHKNESANFTLSSLDEGSANSAFAVDYGYDGKKIIEAIKYKTVGFSLDFLMDNKIINEYPALIKIDVDGNENLVLQGAKKTLANKKCRSVLVEVNADLKANTSEIAKILKNAKFKLKSQSGSNQIWVKG